MLSQGMSDERQTYHPTDDLELAVIEAALERKRNQHRQKAGATSTPQCFPALNERTMKKYILNFAYYAFYLLFIFFCFQTAHIELNRDDSGMVQASLTREHFWGLIQFHKTINNVKGAGVNYAERTSARASGTSAVSIYSEISELPVFLGSWYEYGNNVQEDIVKQVNSFVHNASARDSSGRHTQGQIFPWLIFIFIAAHLWNDLGLNDWYIRVRKRNMLKNAKVDRTGQHKRKSP